MKDGFFNDSELVSSKTSSTLPHCGLCGLYRTCHSPKMGWSGKGRKGVLIVAEAQGEQEDLHGTQLIGKAGKYFRSLLSEVGIDLDKDCWKVNAVACRPLSNKTPSDKIIQACRPKLLKTIKHLKPKTIILLGGTAVESLIPTIWREEVGAISRWSGWNIPSMKYNAWICPTYHPSYLMRLQDDLADNICIQHLKKAFKHQECPWMGDIPDLEKDVEVIIKSSDAVSRIKGIIKDEKEFAFDYETNCLKPEEKDSEIICCSIATVDGSFSFPWTERTATTMSSLLKSPIPKVGANIKFENRWTMAKLGHWVRGWSWDCMLASHVLDNRHGITSVKFQALVRLGLEAYDNDIKPYLRSKGGLNRIRELNINKLLLYCGMDSLVELTIAKIQRKEMDRQWKKIKGAR